MDDSNRYTDPEYEKGDSCYAIITSRSSKGAYLDLDNGQSAFAYGAANLQNGTKILCTVAKPAAIGKRILVRLDSVCGLYGASA